MMNNAKARLDVAFVIVSFNASHYIPACIDSIQKHFSASTTLSYSIVIVDNASTDGSRELLSKLEKEHTEIHSILLDQNIGFGPANNVGFQTVSADYYVLINTDAWLIADTVSDVIAILSSNQDIAICGLPLVFPDGAPQTHSYKFTSWKRWLLLTLGIRSVATRLLQFRWLTGILSQLPYGREFVLSQSRQKISPQNIDATAYSKETRDVDWVCGAAMVIQGKFIHAIGGFDANIFLYGEDEDLCISAHKKSLRVITIDIAPIVHVFGWGGNRFNQTVAELKYHSLQYFISKHFTGISALMMRILLPVQIFGWRFWRCRAKSSHR